jgi:SAM-dependent methyltransferase
MTTIKTSSTGSAQMQAILWGARARDWADFAEGLSRELFEAVFDRLAFGPGTKLLDVGCGSGVAAALAVERGARVSGVDATPELLKIARERVPAGEFQQGDMEQLPYLDDTFDVVTGFNAFQYAANPSDALAEARRVTRPEGSVAVATWGRAEYVDMAVVLKALASLLPPPPPGAPGPFALSEEGALAALVRQVGLDPHADGVVTCRWDFPDLDTTLRTVLSAGPAARVIAHAGEERTREAVAAAITTFRTSTGGYHLESEFIYLIART